MAGDSLEVAEMTLLEMFEKLTSPVTRDPSLFSSEGVENVKAFAVELTLDWSLVESEYDTGRENLN